MKKLTPTLLADWYKIAHRLMYPSGTQTVYSTWTARTSRMLNVNKVIAFGMQAFIKKYLIDYFQENFFSRPKNEVLAEYSRVVRASLGDPNPDTSHLSDLHDLGYLPLSIKALAEGTSVPLRVPMLTIENTDTRFFWLTNYIESLASSEMWQASTSATIANEYRKVLNKYALETVGNTDFVQFQGHDFSFRGMSSVDSAVNSGMGHLLSFVGTDTIPAIQGTEIYYNANIDNELIGLSVPASEHSVQSSFGDDMKYLDNVLSKVHPSGFVSIVSDGYDFWDVIGRVIPALKDKIMARTGGPVGDRVVIRPDSGDPVRIVTGDDSAPEGSLQRKGAVEALWDIFGGTTTAKGYKLLDSHIGLIYGDAITLSRAAEISERLMEKGFASINCVYGIGSYTYQYNTRDTFGFALKSTSVTINGDEKAIYKNPKTDDGTKISQKGRVAVVEENGQLKLVDNLLSTDNVPGNKLVEIFRDGKLLVDENFSTIRARLASQR